MNVQVVQAGGTGGWSFMFEKKIGSFHKVLIRSQEV